MPVSIESVIYDRIELLRNRYERLYEPYFYRALIKQLDRVNRSFASGGIPIDFVVDDSEIRRVYAEFYETTIVAFAGFEYDLLTGKNSFMEIEGKADGPDKEGWRRLVRNSVLPLLSERVKAVAAYSKKKMQQFVNEAFAAGLSLDAMAKEVRRRWRSLSKERAEAIVRTEMLTGSNLGLLVGADSTGQNLQKEWLSTLDDRTRDTHIKMHRVRVGVDEDFLLAGRYPAAYPGDLRLPPKELIRCRCTMRLVPNNNRTVNPF